MGFHFGNWPSFFLFFGFWEQGEEIEEIFGDVADSRMYEDVKLWSKPQYEC